MSTTHRRSLFDGFPRARRRIYGSLLFGVLVFAADPARLNLPVRFLIGWDSSMSLYLLLTFVMMALSTGAAIQRRAIGKRDGRWAILTFMTLATAASMVAIGEILGGLRGVPHEQIARYLTLCGLTVVESWLLVNIIFAQIYSHEYFGPWHPPDQPPVLDFPGDETPDYWDFLYFSMVIGTTCQVSDVPIRTRVLRRLVMVHSVISFFFNTVILALAVNIAVSLL
jgi:uncharacterized membrane protein